ncbi:hypothetical protein LCGC14_2260500, partial [marine sediment metagenome]
PKPSHLTLIEGNPGKRAINRNEPKPQPIAPPCPAWLDYEAKAEWKRVAPELERLGLLTIVDRAALAAYCIAWSHLRKAQEKLQKGDIISPYFTVVQRAQEKVRQFCAEFGLTPSSRGRMSVPEGGEKDPSWLN